MFEWGIPCTVPLTRIRGKSKIIIYSNISVAVAVWQPWIKVSITFFWLLEAVPRPTGNCFNMLRNALEHYRSFRDFLLFAKTRAEPQSILTWNFDKFVPIAYLGQDENP